MKDIFDSYTSIHEERIKEFIEEMVRMDETHVYFDYLSFMKDFEFTEHEDVSIGDMIDVHLDFIPGLYARFERYIENIAAEVIAEVSEERKEGIYV